MAVLTGHEVLSTLKCGGRKVPVGSFVEAGALSERDIDALIAAQVLGPEMERTFADDVSDVLIVMRDRGLDLPDNEIGTGEPRGTGAPVAEPGAAAATATPGAASATVKAGRTPPAAPKKPTPKKSS